MSSNSPSSTTTSINVADTPAFRTAIGRDIADNPASLAAASPARLAPAVSADSINFGLNVGSQVVVGPIKPMDCKTITGSNPGDHRIPAKDGVTAAIDAIKNQGGPRSQMPGQQNSRSYDESGRAFKSTSTPNVGD
jgi:hypothetical protein